jgi:hypothetical protein
MSLNMAALSPSLKQSGALSFSARAALTAGPDTVANAVLVSLCAGGPLLTLLSQSYANIGAFLDAWAAAGGLVSVQSNNAAAAPVVAWTLSGGLPVLSIDGANLDEVSIRVALSYSASR